jgi:hypothetical protein
VMSAGRLVRPATFSEPDMATRRGDFSRRLCCITRRNYALESWEFMRVILVALTPRCVRVRGVVEKLPASRCGTFDGKDDGFGRS